MHAATPPHGFSGGSFVSTCGSLGSLWLSAPAIPVDLDLKFVLCLGDPSGPLPLPEASRTEDAPATETPTQTPAPEGPPLSPPTLGGPAPIASLFLAPANIIGDITNKQGVASANLNGKPS